MDSEYAYISFKIPAKLKASVNYLHAFKKSAVGDKKNFYAYIFQKGYEVILKEDNIQLPDIN